jgi:hypothetical protein
MAFVTDKEEIKPGLIIFRRADVDHRNWYCRVKLASGGGRQRRHLRPGR